MKIRELREFGALLTERGQNGTRAIEKGVPNCVLGRVFFPRV